MTLSPLMTWAFIALVLVLIVIYTGLLIWVVEAGAAWLRRTWDEITRPDPQAKDWDWEDWR